MQTRQFHGLRTRVGAQAGRSPGRSQVS
jgi:hypothetical protein